MGQEAGEVVRAGFSPRLEGIAAELLEAALVEVPVNAIDLASCCGLHVRFSDVRDAVLYDDTIYVSRRARVSRVHHLVAHELGHWALARAGHVDDELDAEYLAGALLAPRADVERELREGWDLDRFRSRHEFAPASLLARRIAQLRNATAAVYDEGRLRRRFGPPLPRERELVDEALTTGRAVRVDDQTGAWPVLERGWRRVIVVGRSAA